MWGLAVEQKLLDRKQVKPIKDKQANFEKPPKSSLFNKKNQGKNIWKSFVAAVEVHDDDSLADLELPGAQDSTENEEGSHGCPMSSFQKDISQVCHGHATNNEKSNKNKQHGEQKKGRTVKKQKGENVKQRQKDKPNVEKEEAAPGEQEAEDCWEAKRELMRRRRVVGSDDQTCFCEGYWQENRNILLCVHLSRWGQT